MARVSRAQINRAADEMGVPRWLYYRLISQESGGRTDAGSPAGAYGPAQLMPGTARSLGVNPRDPMQNLEGGAKYLAQQIRNFGGRLDLALSAYNSGPGGTEKSGRVEPIAETQNYVRSILGGKMGAVRTPVAAQAVGGGAGTPTVPGPPPFPNPFSSFAANLIGAYHSGDHAGGLQGAISGLRQQIHSNDVAAQSVAQKTPSMPVPDMYSGGNLPAGAQGLVRAATEAKRLGLKLSENPLFGGVDPVHVKNSYHYRTFPGTTIGEAFDASGSPAAMAAFYKWAAASYGPRLTELFYDPLGGVKYGKPIGSIGGHGTHVHFAL